MMKEVVIRFKKLSENAFLPRFSFPDDACFDLFSPIDTIIVPQESKIIDLEIASEFPRGYEVVLRPRSGMGINHGIIVHLGTIDCGYRGSWMVRIFNLGKENYSIKRGDRIIQGALREIPQVKIIETNSLSPSERGKQGLGSTGR
ncbi:dUTP diphosphatase [Candidatus Sordicultor fermentans]|jgi:dUTP pyrophosphatase|uniref:dUTP diphosphatase n=1 Tax=Candidatus Sordicultor fermentans TaxID=1953203 RepID=UPI0016A59CCF|nr:dUTP diphosphatase [Atribacterota bacterium]NLY04940.1 dUTP diphosphatase [Candidatus Atribacteria bacterium]HOA98368.1 dUTP diphosphatase [Candidatus Atribacteria bacterium]HOQ50435.1 dUTP diphosphatase [Candidatus Atribacteria bacterium]HQD32374.1 dUTP diphosphatase [Candidatus Atribacteria bacterium]